MKRDDETVFGLERRKVNKFPSKCIKEYDYERKVWDSDKRRDVNVHVYGICFDPSLSYLSNQDPPRLDGCLTIDKLWTGWSEESFGMFSAVDKDKKRIKEIYDNLEKLNCAIWLGGGGVFKNAGLVIGIINRLPAHVSKAWETHDRESLELKQFVKATEIEETLKKANLRYFALAPEWKDKGKKELRFWLNPFDQDINNSGWFTLEELRLWVEGKGPIPKKNNLKKRHGF
jgi:hypothetical protein